MTPITRFDTGGFTEREPGVWTDEHGLVLSVHFFPLVPDLPAPLDAPGPLYNGLARSVASAGAGLIDAELGHVDGLPAVRQLAKVARPEGRGQVFLGSWTVPRAGCSTVLKVQAGEGPMTGMREAVVLDRLGAERYFAPHPYGPGVTGGLPYHLADLEDWDEPFPDHPLTLVRRTLRRIVPTVALHEQFKALPPFAPQPPQAPRRRWFGRS
ncbi:hypothetical protein [Streptomyces sp. NBC_00503]|uniref:hypothetical protein n=1 Tax=Streptomyces sp. NBC_00503 TaxID=2903659 RepID=UPI002E8023AA|nr:hypothetical protein [Streptomyces sp. NBC_00503]WUD85134.1 hypothetical protein OG490_33780 [Streptomyces sp. NBC_00503]